MSDLVWVELSPYTSQPIRIFKSKSRAFGGDIRSFDFITEMEYADAVSSIRHQIFLRSNGFCELGGEIVLETTGHMHERVHRGKFDEDGHSGEISVANSVFICYICHRREHPEREILFTRRQE